MEKMDGMSMDLTHENIEKLKELFPNIVTEGKVDFDVLRTILGDEVDASKEKYQFTWNGKAEAIKLAQSPSSATLRPCKEKSKDWDATENLYIEGDNLEVLKQLQKTYYGKIKLIYIDPPYNTGTNLIYKNDFSASMNDYLERTNHAQDGVVLSSNPKTSGRFHSDWDSMMLARLILARNLLKDDGFIVIAIDNNELAPLIMMANEVFGESNQLGIVTVVHKPEGRNQEKFFGTSNEYALFYAKDKSVADFENVVLDPTIAAKYDHKDESGNYRLQNFIRMTDGKLAYRSERPNFWYPIYADLSSGFISTSKDKCDENAIEIYPQTKVGVEMSWKTLPDTAQELIDIGNIVLSVDSDGFPSVMEKIRETQVIKTHWIRKEYNAIQYGTKIISDLLGQGIFDFPKSLYLICDTIKLCSSKDDIVLDFFSGSATTAHAIMQLNSEDSGTRKFILVQLPEATDEGSAAYKSGYKTICDIGEERIRRAGEKIKQDWLNAKEEEGLISDKPNEFPVDIGFKVFKLDSTNINPWDNTKEYDEQTIFDTATVFKIDRSKEDILYEIMLKYGVFDQPTTNIEVNGKTMYRVGHRHMIICLEDMVDNNDIEEICKLQPRVVVFKESGFKDDNAKINAEYNLKKAGVEDVKAI